MLSETVPLISLKHKLSEKSEFIFKMYKTCYEFVQIFYALKRSASYRFKA